MCFSFAENNHLVFVSLLLFKSTLKYFILQIDFSVSKYLCIHISIFSLLFSCPLLLYTSGLNILNKYHDVGFVICIKKRNFGT